MTDQERIDARWDMHTQRQVEASKGAAIAITALNSGSWIALLTQVGELPASDVRCTVVLWATGALLGTLLWVLIYLGTIFSCYHDRDRENIGWQWAITANILLGLAAAIGALVCFGLGAASLLQSL